jgi:hypothetical protein
MAEGGYDVEQDRAMEVMAEARRIFGEGDRSASGWFDRVQRRDTISLFVCAVSPTAEEIHELDTIAAEAGLPLTVVPVRYSHAQLMSFYERCTGSGLSSSVVSFGMDSMHNALCVRLRRLDPDALSFFRERIPEDALWIEIEPRAPHALAM